MFTNQFSLQERDVRKDIHEQTGSITPVVKTTVKGNAEKLAQMMLAGQYAEAERVGYEYGPDDQLPDDIVPRPGRGVDPIEVLKYVEAFGQRIRSQIAEAKEKGHVRSDTGVSTEDREGEKSESDKAKEGV